MDEHIISEEPVKKYFSNVACDCGCENLMPQHLVNIGWRYLRGHKPVGGHIITKPPSLNTGRAPRTPPAKTIDAPNVRLFVRSQIMLSITEYTESTKTINELQAQLEQLRTKATVCKETALRMYRGVTLMYPDVHKDEELKTAMECFDVM